MQKVKFYAVDLTKISGKGQFECPRCRIRISPDDKTERAYTILEPVMRGGSLERIIVQCNGCGSQIYLTGFHVLSKLR